MRQPRNFATDRCCHLVSRIANRAFYLSAEERTRFVERICQCELFHGAVPYADAQGGLHCAGWRGESAFASAGVQDHGEGVSGDCEWVGYSTTLYPWSRAERPFPGTPAPSSNRTCGFPAYGFPCETVIADTSCDSASEAPTLEIQRGSFPHISACIRAGSSRSATGTSFLTRTS